MNLAALPVIVAAIAVAALGGCSRTAGDAGFSGYIEADYVRVAAPLGGQLVTLAVERGARVTPGTPLFTLESDAERAARAEAEARVARAQAALADLEKARRPPEIAAARAQLAQATATRTESESELRRTERLVAERFLAPQRLDEARAALERARARVAELEAMVALANLPARSDAIAVAQAEVRAATDALTQAQWRVNQKAQAAPVDALVVDTLYRPGEWVPAGAPVVSLLPPGNLKIRFFVPEPALSSLHVGDAVVASCDGCPAGIEARVSYIAPEAEYTPPVIYSRENRAKLVFMAEARPGSPQPALRPGLPVEIARTTR